MGAIDLSKRVEKVGIILEKKGISNVVAQVKLAIDRSGSMNDEYRDGIVQDVVERVLAVGMKFDPDKSIDVFAFHNDSIELPPAKESTISGYVKKEIMNKVSPGGTSYAPVMQDIVESAVASSGKKKGLFGGLFGKKSAPVEEFPTVAIFITDGENDDRSAAKRAIIDSQDKNIYWVLIGIGNGNFSFIEQLGEEFPNAGYFCVKDIRTIDDDDLYSLIISDELAQWVKKFQK